MLIICDQKDGNGEYINHCIINFTNFDTIGVDLNEQKVSAEVEEDEEVEGEVEEETVAEVIVTADVYAKKHLTASKSEKVFLAKELGVELANALVTRLSSNLAKKQITLIQNTLEGIL